jgi:hypothetical protein
MSIYQSLKEIALNHNSKVAIVSENESINYTNLIIKIDTFAELLLKFIPLQIKYLIIVLQSYFTYQITYFRKFSPRNIFRKNLVMI